MIDTDDEIDALENFPEDQENNDKIISEENVQKYYDEETHISKPFRVKNGTVPINILEFEYPFMKLQTISLIYPVFIFLIP